MISMTRYESRVKAAQTLYQMDLIKADSDLAYQYAEALNQGEILIQNYPVDEFAKALIDGVIEHLEAIDEVISSSLVKWTLSRMSYLDRAIVRIATYEMMFTNIPTTIIINEAVEISKAYTDLEDGASSKFNNKLLDTISKSLAKYDG
jgi:N utilization substance protein B